MSRNKDRATTARYVILFDIDGTLLTGPDRGQSAGFMAMTRAVEQIAGKLGEYESKEFAGRTDLQIARSLLITAGEREPSQERVQRVVAQYVAFLKEEVKKAPYASLGSPRDTVNELSRNGALVGLGTGNVRSGAAVKFESAGLDGLFDLERGGFGDDGDTRAEVLERGAASFDPARCLPVVIVGDTPHDIAAAKKIGAKCIGVPYRHNDMKTLKNAGADAIVGAVDVSLVSIVELITTDRHP